MTRVNQQIRVSVIDVSNEIGYVLERHNPTAYPDPPIIIHILEAHQNYEASKNMVAILEELVKCHGLKLILVEGGEGDVSLSDWRRYGPPEHRRQVAEKYLKLGILSGEEYLDLISDYPLTLWGVERRELYQKNVDAFFVLEKLRDSLGPVLAAFRGALEAVKLPLAGPELCELDTKSAAYDQEQLDLGAYAQYLWRLAKKEGIGADEYPMLETFLHLAKFETTVTIADIEKERRNLIVLLGQRLGDEDLSSLVEQARDMKTKEGQSRFYEEVVNLAAKVSLDIGTLYPKLSDYIGYLRASRELKIPALDDELTRLRNRIRRKLFVRLESGHWHAVERQVYLVAKALDLKLNPDEYRLFKDVRTDGLLAQWHAFLGRVVTGQLALPSQTEIDAAQSALATLKHFYDIALQRAEIIVGNAIEKLEQTGERIAALITGGFCRPFVIPILKRRSLGIVVLAPRVVTKTNDHLYREVMKYKNGQSTLGQVTEIANELARNPFNLPGEGPN